MVERRRHLRRLNQPWSPAARCSFGFQSSRRSTRLLRATVVALTWTLASVTASGAAVSIATEYEVKAAYLFNFAKFVQWPARSVVQGNTFPLCVLGVDPFGQVLDATIDGETIRGQKVIVRRTGDPEAAASCRVLFISASEDSELPKILAVLDGSSILTVSDMPQFSSRGGMIQLFLDDQHIRFDVNLAAAERVGLTLSSQLLKLAVHVTSKSQRARPGAGD
jgi:YfiR/HmsC-like